MDFSLSNLSSSKSEPDLQIVKVLIIGSGPAGLSAGLYTARADLEPVILSGMELGGQVSLTNIVENYPGFPNGVGGQELVELFQKQAERFGAKIVFDTAIEVDFTKPPYKIKTYNAEYLTDTVIITTGATPRHLEVPGETEFTGRGVSYCATCDGWFFKEKEVVVVGGGDSALEESLFLTRYSNKVTIVHRRDELRAGQILQKRAFANEKIGFIWNSVITAINGDQGVKSVTLKNLETGELSELNTDGVFIFIGHIPNTDLFVDQLEIDKLGYLTIDKYMQTVKPGIYAAGEVADPHYRQVITSAGMGAGAGIQAVHYLTDLYDK